MDNTITYKSITNYFNALATSGYKSYKETYKLILLLFIEELFDSSMGLYLTEDDYRTITNVLDCIYGSSCIIPIPEHTANTSLVQALNTDINRISETGLIRFTEDEQFKLLNY